MRRSVFIGLFAASSFWLAGAAQASLIHFETILSGANENPAVVTPGFGTATVDIDTVALTMFVDATFADLLGTTVAAHIHCCRVPPTNAGVATQVPTFANLPLGVHSGSFTQLLDMTLASSFNPTFITNNGGTPASAFAALLAGMIAGQSYFNIHTSEHMSGEIRGQLAVIPEPASLALLGIALAGIGALSRPRRAK